MSDTPEKDFAEFFAGIGLMRMGLERAGWRIAFANDIDEDKWEMYRQHFGDSGKFVVGDIHKLDAESIPDVALAAASFPCNDLSLAGVRLS
ncbi:MAG: DNA cytosine methyltransferase [Verrucomicrobiia bacterium]|jgi:DNA (cytosine-5)-methyltransferase 1